MPAVVDSHTRRVLQAQPSAMAPQQATGADDALRLDWDGPQRPWLPDPAALAQPHWPQPHPSCSMVASPLACAAMAQDRPFLTHAGNCGMPAAVAPPARDHHVLMPLQPAAPALDSSHMSGCRRVHTNERGHPPLHTGFSGSLAPQPVVDGGWHAQPTPPCISMTAAGLAPPVSQVSSGSGAPVARAAEQPSEGRRLMHQPSFAAWVPPHRVLEVGLVPLQAPAVEHWSMSPFGFGPTGTDQYTGERPSAVPQSAAPNLPLAQRDTRDPQTDAQYPVHMVQPLQQAEPSDRSTQAPQQMQPRRAGASVLLAPSGASLPGDEDSLCAFLGGWQRTGAAPQPKSGLGRHDAVRHAVVSAAGGRGPEPASAADGRLSTAMPCRSQLQPRVADSQAEEATALLMQPQRSAGAAPAQPGPAPSGPHIEQPAALDVVDPHSEAIKDASGGGPPVAAAAEQLMHAEGEDFWRSLLTVVRDYKGEAASACMVLHILQFPMRR